MNTHMKIAKGARKRTRQSSRKLRLHQRCARNDSNSERAGRFEHWDILSSQALSR